MGLARRLVFRKRLFLSCFFLLILTGFARQALAADVTLAWNANREATVAG